MKKTLFILIGLFVCLSSYAQTYGAYSQYANINFEDGTSSDVLGNADAVLLNGAKVVADNERNGNVMHFDASQSGHLKFQKSPLNDVMTLSFWFKQEDYSANSFWKMMFSFYANDGGNVYLTPLTSWSANSFFIYDNKQYSIYKSLEGKPVTNKTWVHIAVVINDNNFSVYQNGVLVTNNTLLTKLSDVNTVKWYFGNNPELPYNMSGMIDDIQVFHSALTSNQITALKEGKPIPTPIDSSKPYAWFPLASDYNDIIGNNKVESTLGVNFASDVKDRSFTKISQNGYIKFNNHIIGDKTSSLAFLFKKSIFTTDDNGKYILKYNADNEDFIGVRLNVENEKAFLQLVSNIEGDESILTTSGSKYLNANEWNSLVFVQTYTVQGTAAIKVYLNGYSAMVKARVDINKLPCTNLTIGNKVNGLAFNVSELKVLHYEMNSSQVLNYNNSQVKSVSFVANLNKTYQTICNFGSSDGWNAQPVGLYFSDKKKDEVAQLLFSTENDENGNPLGIGLSAWRFNIGAGTYEQGTNSRITAPERRTECFLNNDGTYDWSKQAGQRWFLEQAVKKYNVPDIIGWQNSPPVQYTVRGLGFREFGDEKKTILKSDKFDDFGTFLSTVIKHFKEEGINIKYISPLNEPQWDWTVSGAGKNADQEGTPWTNEEIRDVVRAINSEFVKNGIESKIFITEAGSISSLLEGTGVATDQLNKLWNPLGSCFIGSNLNNFSNIISSHSYWSDGSAQSIVNTRQSLKEKMDDFSDYQYWQTEYSLLGSGYNFGFPNDRTITPMESGISLARVMHNDLAIANATGWQWWTTFELDGYMNAEDRFSLFRVAFNKDKTQGIYKTTKLLYALGNYSRFIRPGMKRIDVSRSDNASDIEAVSSQMVSAFYDDKDNTVVMVVVNASAQDCGIKVDVDNLPIGLSVDEFIPYITTDLDNDNLKKYPAVKKGSHYVIPGTSIVTFVSKTTILGVESILTPTNKLVIYPNPVRIGENIMCNVIGATKLTISDINGREVARYDIMDDSNGTIQIPTSNLKSGLYIISTITNEGDTESQKIIVR